MNDERLIDNTITALQSTDWPTPTRTTATQLVLGDGVFIDAGDGTLNVTAYPNLEAVPSERFNAVAELMNLIASAGVPFTLALDLERGVVSLRNNAFIAGTAEGRERLIRDLLEPVVYAPVIWLRPLQQVAFEQVDPTQALAEAEQFAVHFEAERTIEEADRLIEQFGASRELEVSERVTQALTEKASALRLLGQFDEALVAYDQVIERFGDDVAPDLREEFGMALFNRGLALARLTRVEEAAEAFDLVVERLGDAPELDLRDLVAAALSAKAYTFYERGLTVEQIAVLDVLIERFKRANKTGWYEQLKAAQALFSSGVALGELARPDEEIAAYDQLIELFGDSSDPELREQVEKALFNKGYVLGERWKPDAESGVRGRLGRALRSSRRKNS